jgi:hypothetical protein
MEAKGFLFFCMHLFKRRIKKYTSLFFYTIIPVGCLIPRR